jgi:hypothetical protein
MLLERRCRVCAWNVPGCPGCWRPAGAMRGYNKHGSDKAYHRAGAKDDSHGAKGSFAPSAVTHTHLLDREAVAIYRRSQCFVNVCVWPPHAPVSIGVLSALRPSLRPVLAPVSAAPVAERS